MQSEVYCKVSKWILHHCKTEQKHSLPKGRRRGRSAGPQGNPLQSHGPPKLYLGYYFSEGVNFKNEKMTRRIGSSSGTPASSGGPTVSKRTRWQFISPPICSSGQLALDLGPHSIQRGQFAICTGPPRTLFLYLDLGHNLSPRAPWSSNGPGWLLKWWKMIILWQCLLSFVTGKVSKKIIRAFLALDLWAPTC